MKFIIISLILLFSISCKSQKSEEEAIQDAINDICGSEILGPCVSDIKNFFYPANQIVLTKNQENIYVLPSYSNTAEVEFYPHISLPSGLVINRDTGLIAGSPTSIQNEITYTIIIRYKDESIRNQFLAKGLSGYISTFDIKIKVLDIPPSNMVLNKINNVIDRRDILSPIKVSSVGGGAVVSYSVQPTLPAGLILNTQTGEISGSPVFDQTNTEYTLTAKNTGGETSVKFYIEVKGVAPNNLKYLDQSISYYTGENIPRNNLPIYSGDQAVSYNITPTLPEGLIFNNESGVISGNPKAVTQNKVYTVIATNIWGSTNSNIELSTLSNITEISTGFNHSCVIKNKTVRCSGQNEYMQLGRVSTETCIDGSNQYDCSRTYGSVLINNSPLESLSVKSIRNSNCSLGVDKKVYCWGENSLGQLGSGIYSPFIEQPTIVKDENNLDLINIKKIEGGESHFCAQNESNEIYCWGNNNYGQLGRTVILSSALALKLTDESGFISGTDFSTGFENTCYVKLEKLKCIGFNDYYNLGNGTSNTQLSFVETIELSDNQPIKLIKNIILGDTYSLAVRTNGDVYSWGTNTGGQLATGDTVTYMSARPTDVNGNPINNIKISKGKDSFCYIKDSYGYCVGLNYYNFGEPTNNSINPNPVPIIEKVNEQSESIPLFGITQISSGYSFHRCVSKRGELFCFGNNKMGQLGDGSSVERLLPKLITLPE